MKAADIRVSAYALFAEWREFRAGLLTIVLAVWGCIVDRRENTWTAHIPVSGIFIPVKVPFNPDHELLLGFFDDLFDFEEDLLA